MTDRDALLRRIEALLHHPPERSLTEGFEDKAERKAAREHLGIVGMSPRFESAVDAADHVAAGSNEYGFPKQRQPGSQEGVAPVEWGRRPVLRHPLSGAALDLEARQPTFTYKATSTGDATLRSAVDTALNAASAASGSDYEKLALWLWRNLSDQLNEDDRATPWPLLPADPRIPDHSVWEHLSLTAALATAGLGPRSGTDPGDWQAGTDQPSTASLLLFTIGPVQGFVGAARKTRDLQAGSYLLSYLTWHAIQVVADAFGPESILFPDLRRQPLVDRWLKTKNVEPLRSASEVGSATIPNRFFAVVPDGEADPVAACAERAVRREFARIGSYALQKIQGKINASWQQRVDWDAYEKQVRDYFECYWTILPLHRFGEHKPALAVDQWFYYAFQEAYPGFLKWDDEKANAILKAFSMHKQQPNVGAVYGRLYRLTEALTGSRKALRNFDPVTEHGYRCSLIPSLPALAPCAASSDTHTDAIKTPSTSDQRRFWEHVARRMERGFVAEREQLSAVALAKRFVGDYLGEEQGISFDARFPSTGSFATADFKADVISVLKGESLPGKQLPDEGKVEKLRDALDKLRNKLQPLSNAFNELTETALPKLQYCVAENIDDEDWEALVQNTDKHLAWFAALDGGWLFTGYDAKQIAKEYGFSETEKDSGVFRRASGRAEFTKGQVEDAERALGAFLSAATDAGIDRPSKYYAVLQMDGDEMGKWLSGQNAPRFGDMLHPDFATAVKNANAEWKDLIAGNTRRPLTPALHLAISRALGVFSLDLVPRLTEQEHLARRIYSGGDDVLAFVSFRDALPLARRLRAAFSGQVRIRPEGEEPSQGEERLDDNVPAGHIGVAWSEPTGYVRLNGELLPTMGHTATASTGIVIAHYKHSLQHVFREAHKACEDYAKEELKRNALAVTVLKRSGERFQTGTKWHTTVEKGKDRRVDIDLAETLEHYADLVRGGWVASGYMYDLEIEARGLSVFEKTRKSGENGVLSDAHEAVQREAYQLFRRRTEALRHPEVEQLPRWLREAQPATDPSWLAEKPDSTKPDWPARAFAATVLPLLDHNPLDRLITLLDAAQFFGQGGDR